MSSYVGRRYCQGRVDEENGVHSLIDGVMELPDL